ncbi:MAG: hypothetical protein NTY55_11230 [Flavobacteriia bacterium]|nr:hypothetical protein [Flavobacteriia bacterium]
MNKKTLMIIGGVVAVGIIAFATKKFWYKPKSSFLNMEDEEAEQGEEDVDMSLGMGSDDNNSNEEDDVAMGIAMGIAMGGNEEEAENVAESIGSEDVAMGMAMGMALASDEERNNDDIVMGMGASDDAEINTESMGDLLKGMGSPASIIEKPIQETILQAKAKNLSNPNTPNFTPKMPNKRDLVKAKRNKIAKKVGIGLLGGGIGLLAKKLIDKKKGKTPKPNERTGGKPKNTGIGGALKQKRAMQKVKVKSRKRNFSDFLDFEDFN